MKTPLRIGIGGPVGSGKTALVDALCKAMRDRYRLGVITNDIFTREDMEFLVRSQALPDRPFVFTNLKSGAGLEEVVTWIQRELLYETPIHA